MEYAHDGVWCDVGTMVQTTLELYDAVIRYEPIPAMEKPAKD
jgi:hypothetical protein